MTQGFVNAQNITLPLAVSQGGTGVTTSTGTGSVVLSTSPTLTTPNIGNTTLATSASASRTATFPDLTGTVALSGAGQNVQFGQVGANGPNISTYALTAHGGTNQNLTVGPAISIANSVCLGAVNDANSVNIPLEIRASGIYASAGMVAGAGTNVVKFNTSTFQFTYENSPSTFYVNTANTTITSLSVVKYSNVVNDSASGYSTGTGLYTIPQTGWYMVHANIKTTSYNFGVGAIIQMDIYQNSTIIAQQLITPTAYNATSLALNAGTVYYFTAGDTVSVQAFSNLGGGGGTTLDNSVTNFLSINFLHS